MLTRRGDVGLDASCVIVTGLAVVDVEAIGFNWGPRRGSAPCPGRRPGRARAAPWPRPPRPGRRREPGCSDAGQGAERQPRTAGTGRTMRLAARMAALRCCGEEAATFSPAWSWALASSPRWRTSVDRRSGAGRPRRGWGRQARSAAPPPRLPGHAERAGLVRACHRKWLPCSQLEHGQLACPCPWFCNARGNSCGFSASDLYTEQPNFVQNKGRMTEERNFFTAFCRV